MKLAGRKAPWRNVILLLHLFCLEQVRLTEASTLVFFCNIPVGSMTLDYLSVFGHIVSMTTCACVLQHFIFMTISTFGPLTCSIITTTRKFFTILSSVILFQHPITLLQWFGTTLVFAGLMLDTIFGKERLVIPVVHKTAGVTNCL